MSVCLSHSPSIAACGGFAAVGPASTKYRSIAAAAGAAAGSATLSAYVGSGSILHNVSVTETMQMSNGVRQQDRC